MHALTQYYGADWIDMIGTVATIILLGNKAKIGFIANIIGCIGGVFMAVMINSIPFVILNAVVIFFSATGFLKWQKSNRLELKHAKI